MSQPVLYPPSDFELLSMEEQIDYVEANLPRLISELMANETIPMWHREILADRLTRFRSQVESAIPLEEFEKELTQG
jgi:hypothetical protein